MDIVRAGRNVAKYLGSMSEEDFLADGLVHSAVIYQLMIMGEATKRLPGEFTAEHPEIDWRGIAGFRDIMIHHYDRINLSRDWLAASIAAPKVVAQLSQFVEEPS